MKWSAKQLHMYLCVQETSTPESEHGHVEPQHQEKSYIHQYRSKVVGIYKQIRSDEIQEHYNHSERKLFGQGIITA